MRMAGFSWSCSCRYCPVGSCPVESAGGSIAASTTIGASPTASLTGSSDSTSTESTA